MAKYNLLRKCVRWWKTLFFHMVDMGIVNGFILFQASFPKPESGITQTTKVLIIGKKLLTTDNYSCV